MRETSLIRCSRSLTADGSRKFLQSQSDAWLSRIFGAFMHQTAPFRTQHTLPDNLRYIIWYVNRSRGRNYFRKYLSDFRAATFLAVLAFEEDEKESLLICASVNAWANSATFGRRLHRRKARPDVPHSERTKGRRQWRNMQSRIRCIAETRSRAQDNSQTTQTRQRRD